MSDFRIAAVSFLNTFPLIDWFDGPGAGSATVRRDLPSRLGGLLASGSADVGLLPVAETLRGAAGGFISTAGISCRGAVDSVKVFTRSDVPGLTRLRCDRGSRSSVALLRVLLAEEHGLRPEMEEMEPRPGLLPEPGEGLLIIGDRCFQYEKFLAEARLTDVQGHDLGQMWFDLTGLPFVFATWAMAPDFLERRSQEDLRQLAALLDRARDFGEAHFQELAERAAASGSLGAGGRATTEAIAYYFRVSMKYRLGEDARAGIRRFHELGVRHQVLPEHPGPVFL